LPELIKQLLNLDSSKKQEVSDSRKSLEKLDSFSRERIRNTVTALLTEVRNIEKGSIIDVKVENNKTKSKRLGRIIKKERRAEV
jgi:hypothetical protein